MASTSGPRRYAKLAVLVALILTAASVVVSDRISGTAAPPAGPPLPVGWAGFDAERAGLIRRLAEPVRACIGRVEARARASAMFHGCGDWHNATAAHYALYTAYLRTGDVAYFREAERQIRADRVAVELAFLPQLENPNNWRRYYGYPWLLALVQQRDAAVAMARERGEPTGEGVDLHPLAAEAVAWLSDWLVGLDAERGRQHVVADNYENLSWTLLNLVRWARHTGDEALLALARAVVDVHLRPAAVDSACPVSRDVGADVRGFIPPCLMRLGAVVELDGAAAKGWVEARIPVGFSAPPLTAPSTAEATGLNFHRAAMLWSMYEVTGRTALRDNYATLIRFHTARPHQWRDDYRRHAQWIPQFGIHAIEQSYGSD